jgi:hypothetical protein
MLIGQSCAFENVVNYCLRFHPYLVCKLLSNKHLKKAENNITLRLMLNISLK